MKRIVRQYKCLKRMLFSGCCNVCNNSTGEKADQILNYQLKDSERSIETMSSTMRLHAEATGYIATAGTMTPARR